MIIDDFKILLEYPEFPVIIVGVEHIHSCFDVKDFVTTVCSCNDIPQDERNTKVIDANGREFWFEDGRSLMVPAFFPERWTKKKIIDLYNRTREDAEKIYIDKPFSNKKIKELIHEICLRLVHSTKM